MEWVVLEDGHMKSKYSISVLCLCCAALFLYWLVSGWDLNTQKGFHLENDIIDLREVEQSIAPFDFVFINDSDVPSENHYTQRHFRHRHNSAGFEEHYQ